MALETQTNGALYQFRGVGWGRRWEGGSKGGGDYMYTYGWFILRFDRKQQNSIKQLSFDKKKKTFVKTLRLTTLLSVFSRTKTLCPFCSKCRSFLFISVENQLVSFHFFFTTSSSWHCASFMWWISAYWSGGKRNISYFSVNLWQMIYKSKLLLPCIKIMKRSLKFFQNDY